MARVFISYCMSDGALARCLAEELRAAGHDVWSTTSDINAGDSFDEPIRRSLEAAEYVVLCVSASTGVDSSVTRHEWEAVVRHYSGRAGILPVRLTGGDLPAIMADTRYADLGTDWARSVAELLKAIDSGLASLSSREAPGHLLRNDRVEAQPGGPPSDSPPEWLLAEVRTVVDDPEAWIHRPNAQFNGRRPIDLVGTADEPILRNLIEAAKQGAFS